MEGLLQAIQQMCRTLNLAHHPMVFGLQDKKTYKDNYLLTIQLQTFYFKDIHGPLLHDLQHVLGSFPAPWCNLTTFPTTVLFLSDEFEIKVSKKIQTYEK